MSTNNINSITFFWRLKLQRAFKVVLKIFWLNLFNSFNRNWKQCWWICWSFSTAFRRRYGKRYAINYSHPLTLTERVFKRICNSCNAINHCCGRFVKPIQSGAVMEDYVRGRGCYRGSDKKLVKLFCAWLIYVFEPIVLWALISLTRWLSLARHTEETWRRSKQIEQND